MGLFGKRPPCVFCGGKVKGLLAYKVEGQFVCDDCYGVVDLPKEVNDTMTVDRFRSYMAFREENNKLKEKFNVTDEIDLGFFGTKIVFDRNNGLFCMDKNLGKTIFEGNQIESFFIKEDNTVLFEGSAAGLRRHQSTVPERVMALVPQIERVIMQKQMQETMNHMLDMMDKDDDRNRHVRSQYVDIPEPFRKFNIEIRLRHPYWYQLTEEKGGPTFSNSNPDVQFYLNEYNDMVALMERLALNLMEMITPGQVREIGSPASQEAPAASAPASQGDDVVEMLQRLKTLVDQGIITEEEFAAKKRQLLGI